MPPIITNPYFLTVLIYQLLYLTILTLTHTTLPPVPLATIITLAAVALTNLVPPADLPGDQPPQADTPTTGDHDEQSEGGNARGSLGLSNSAIAPWFRGSEMFPAYSKLAYFAELAEYVKTELSRIENSIPAPAQRSVDPAEGVDAARNAIKDGYDKLLDEVEKKWGSYEAGGGPEDMD